tara:strand:- start:4611 stop:4979 length:369 start_codon:yes stop_codon:yes gene_type:complete
MAGLGPRLPLARDSGDGFRLLKSFERMVRQNLKMLILTVPGERVMEPLYGVGLKRYLFENATQDTYTEIDQRIRQQVNTYMPYVKIQNIKFGASDMDRNQLGIAIKFSIPRIGVTDLLRFTI